MGEPILDIVEESSFSDHFKIIIESTANDSINKHGLCYVGLSGGSLVNLLEQILPKIETNWKNWKFIFCDERIVSFDDPESTYGLYKKKLIGLIPIDESQFIKVNPKLSANEAAIDYEKQLRSHFGDNLPQFDLLLLGLGPDGHTCSLFPQHPLLNENKLWVAPISDSPKPPPSRITLTLPVINNARNCLFAISGKGKADIIKKIFVDKEDLPAGRVKPILGKLYWLLDTAAAAHLPSVS
ncbi:6-phosphogluconolactonase [Halyomorpha halys]|uniref:6-phosphogluconolactonase n=1 Tax=Halyomorpha halys TaxID=286706 RepID=UPI0006D52424|nr:6-phosphogluconolactonase [Halyomorpha halys]XP_014283598.1 6-phosphogluconolactonase [Halyomorpha halys]